MNDHEDREQQSNQLQEQQSKEQGYEELLGELAMLHKELQRDKASPTLVDFAKERIAELSQQKNIIAEVMSELNLLLEEIMRTLISVESSEQKHLQDQTTAIKKKLSPEIVALLGEVREKAYVYLADKKRWEIASQMVSTVQWWSTEFATQSWVVPSLLRRAWRVLWQRLDT